MTIQDITDLMGRLEQSTLTLLEWEIGDERIRLQKEPSPAACQPAAPAPVSPPAADVSAAPVEGTVVKAPLVGTFYAAASPDAAPYVKVGQSVRKGDVLCLIEAMKMMNEIPSPADGTVEAVMAQNGDVISFDTPLFRIKET